MHQGGIPHPEGYELILEIPVDDGNISVQISGLLQHYIIESRSVGVTVCLNRVAVDSEYGTISGRIIHDFIGTCLVFRKDLPEFNVSKFIIEMSHQ